MDTSKVLNLVLAVALVVLSVKITFFDKDKTGETLQADSSSVIIDNIMTRTSVRSYTDKSVEDEKIELILKAGMAAPTARNKQPWVFIVVNDKELLTQMADSLPYAKMAAQASVAIVACGDLSKALEGDAAAYWIQDVSAATENILLAAHGLGLGAVWTGVYPIKERMNTVCRILNLPENIVPLNVIPVGYPKENPVPKDKWKKENVYYNAYK